MHYACITRSFLYLYLYMYVVSSRIHAGSVCTGTGYGSVVVTVVRGTMYYSLQYA